jgi:sRNA-binding regulator protein Hfq
MRKIMPVFLLLSITLLTSTAQADTIHLKNGSVLKGKVTSFADDQFVVMLDTGTGRSMSRAMIYMADVARIEFDSAQSVATDIPARDTSGAAQPRDVQPRETQPRETQSRDTQPRDTQSRDTRPRDSILPDPPPSTTTARDAEVPRPEKTSTSTPVIETSDSERSGARRANGPVKTTSVDVTAKRDWTSTGLIIKRGDRIRITAAGSVTLDPASGQTSGPEGIEMADSKKLMSDHPTGALIGVIGADNDDFIFIGRSAEFTATRDGLLFLSVNEGGLADNTGTYKATIEISSTRAR